MTMCNMMMMARISALQNLLTVILIGLVAMTSWILITNRNLLCKSDDSSSDSSEEKPEALPHYWFQDDLEATAPEFDTELMEDSDYTVDDVVNPDIKIGVWQATVKTEIKIHPQLAQPEKCQLAQDEKCALKVRKFYNSSTRRMATNEARILVRLKGCRNVDQLYVA